MVTVRQTGPEPATAFWAKLADFLTRVLISFYPELDNSAGNGGRIALVFIALEFW